MRVAIGVAGGIAAYKAAELVRVLQERELDVQVVMTRAAREFVTPLTFAALSGHKVITEMFGGPGAEPNLESAIEHIAVAQAIDALVIAPATANVLAKIAHGEADDFLTTLCLATKAPIVLAPAMNINMWENSATQENLKTLRERGFRIVEPGEGHLACGMTGPGRLAEVEDIARAIFDVLELKNDLAGETVLVTAGPTEEPLDAVRFLSNRSSGRMGYALAKASRDRGARVILVSGPAAIEPPAGVTLERVGTAEEMARAVFHHLDASTIVLMAAAVADFRPAEVRSQKIKKQTVARSLELVPTIDILAEVSRRRRGQLLVGFAAETENLMENARAKLEAKGLDLVVANDLTEAGAGFGSETNIVTLVFPGGRAEKLEKMDKLDAARRILDEVVRMKKLPSPAMSTSWARGESR
ncbi:MAG: bifunctional phosphopantothenoylcysteine decarboxylase/phosphopantothenate--cysteine ligase CoaBC [Acidobacteria bacterium]|nr:MAG: bifunctional phosphopantothenoylcysteine decarboxylase/phosphopantothenate--cysteine ligase CoaBC [Acidobacteriota bacterium]